MRSAEPLPERGPSVLRSLRRILPTGDVHYPPPEADQLTVLDALPDGETLGAWMPDSTAVCTVAVQAIEAIGSSPGNRSFEPLVLDDPTTYSEEITCAQVPERPKVTNVGGLNGSFVSTDGYGKVLLLTGPDEPLVARDPSTHTEYGAMPQRVLRADDGRTFRLAHYQNVPFTFRDAEVCTVSGDRCLSVDERH
ncbi:hypothetical protein JNUCC62_12800 [Kitasatospora griseola]